MNEQNQARSHAADGDAFLRHTADSAPVIEAELRKHMIQPRTSTWHADTAAAVLDALTAAGYMLVRVITDTQGVCSCCGCAEVNDLCPWCDAEPQAARPSPCASDRFPSPDSAT